MGILDDLFWRTDPHQVTRLVLRKMFERRFDDLARQFARLAHTESPNRVTRKSNFYRALRRFTPQLPIHSTLHDSEEGLGSLGAETCHLRTASLIADG